MTTVQAETPAVSDLMAACDELAQTEPGNTQKIASLLQQMIIKYYADVLRQAKQSFYCALAAAIIGSLFFGFAVWPMKDGSGTEAGIIAGAIVSLISGLNFWLYGRAARQFSMFHVCLERANRFMLANTLCENLGTDARDELRAELVRIVANAPMITADIVDATSHDKNNGGSPADGKAA